MGIDARSVLAPWIVGATVAAVWLLMARPLRLVLGLGALFGLASAAYFGQFFFDGTSDVFGVAINVAISLAGALFALGGLLPVHYRGAVLLIVAVGALALLIVAVGALAFLIFASGAVWQAIVLGGIYFLAWRRLRQTAGG